MAERITYQIVIDASSAQAALKSLADGLARLQNAVPKISSEIGKAEQKIAKMAATSGKAGKATSDLAAAKARLAKAVKDTQFDKEISGLSRAEAAAKKYERAQRELNAARRQRQRAEASGNTDRATKAYNREAVATRELSKAKKELTTARNQEAAAAAKSQQAAALKAQKLEAERANAAAVNLQKRYDSLANTRYALYDVATTFTALSVATGYLAKESFQAARNFEDLFTSVERTSGLNAGSAEMQALRDTLTDLSTQLPITIEDITKIATLAGQLGVAAQDIDDFTESIAQFSAITGVSVDTAAESIGRIAQLAKVSNYEALTSAIYETGVNAVATEAAILSVGEEITATAVKAGFSADQIIALSSALASLGVQPERARGTFLRVFNQIQASADGLNDKLQGFADVAGLGATEFADAWNSDAQGAFTEFLTGLEELRQEGENTQAVLAGLGIVSVRDVDTIQRLSQNMDVYGAAIEDTTRAYAEGTSVADAYGLVADNLSSILSELGSTLQAILSNFDLEILKGPLNYLLDFLRAVESFSSTGLGKTILTVAVAATALVAGFSGLVAAGSLAIATLFGMTTAIRGLVTVETAGGGAHDLFRTALVQLILTMKGYSQETIVASLNTTKVSQAATMAAASVSGQAISTANATANIKAYTLANKAAIASSAAWTLGIGAAIYGISQIAINSDKAAQAVKDMNDAFATAISDDTKAFEDTGEAIRVVREEAEDSAGSYDAGGAAVTLLAQRYAGLTDGVDDTTDAIKENIAAIGEQTELLLRQNIADELLGDGDANQQAERVAEITAALEAEGVALEDLIQLALQGDTDAIARATSGSLAVGVYGEAYRELSSSILAQTYAINENAAATAVATQVNEALGLSADGTAVALDEEADAAENAATATQALADSVFQASNPLADMQGAVRDLAQSLYDNGGSFSVYTEAGRSNLAALQDAFNAAAEYAGDDVELFNVLVAQIAEAMVESGATSVDQLGFLADAGVQFGEDLARTAALQLSVTRALQAQAAALGANMSGASGAVNAMGARYSGQAAAMAAAGILDVGAAADDMGISVDTATDFMAEFNAILADDGGSGGSTSGSASKASESIRTLTDYVKDLAGVMNSAQGFRFGFQIARDDTADSIQKISDTFEDAEKKARDLRNSLKSLRASMSELAADRELLEYQLNVAIEYGDTLRQSQIQAELEKNAADQAKTQADVVDTTADLADTTDLLNKSLTGSTEGSRENRDMVLSLVDSYREQIEAYANTGASQQDVARYAETLRQQFINEATQLGYNRAEVEKYALAFEDFKKIIATVPRNVDISTSVNLDPAKRALAEFAAGMSKTGRTAGKNYGSGFNAGVAASPDPDPTPTDSAMNSAGKHDATVYSRAYVTRTAAYRGTLIEYADGSKRFSTPDGYSEKFFRKGGYTGDGPRNEIAGAVHKEEFVVPAEVVDKVGLPFLNGLGTSTAMASPNVTVMSPSSGNSVSVIELGPKSLRAVQQGGQVVVALDGKAITSTVNKHNANNRAFGG